MEGIQSTVIDFLLAFSRLDINGMMACFEDDATSFFPVSHHIVMLNGKSEIRDAFDKVLSRIRASGQKSIKLEPEDVKSQIFGDTAIVTFHIRDGDLSRRTLVLRRKEGRWLIQHLHASNAPLGEPR
jgi:ketosteroid isomerase-like protein